MRLLTGMIVATVALAAAEASAAASPIARAGEWETTMGSRRFVVCLQHDRPFDSLASMTRGMPGVKCAPVDFHQLGSVATFSLSCQVAGGTMTSHGTVTFTGPDSYTSRVQSHMIGGQMAIPDMDMTQVGRRLGDCKPGDRVSPN